MDANNIVFVFSIVIFALVGIWAVYMINLYNKTNKK